MLLFVLVIYPLSSFSLLLLPRLGLWSRDKAAKGAAEVTIMPVGRIDVTTTKIEVVGEASVRDGPRRPVITTLTSVVEQLIVSIDIPAPHKEEWTERDIIRITIYWTSTSKTANIMCTS